MATELPLLHNPIADITLNRVYMTLVRDLDLLDNDPELAPLC